MAPSLTLRHLALLADCVVYDPTKHRALQTLLAKQHRPGIAGVGRGARRLHAPTNAGGTLHNTG